MVQFDPTTEPELLEALATVMRQAHGNGVTVTNRSVEVRNRDMPDWELMMHRLAAAPESESADSRHA